MGLGRIVPRGLDGERGKVGFEDEMLHDLDMG